MTLLRPLEPADVEDVLALNERNVAMLAPLTTDRLNELRALAHRFDVVQVDDRFAGFVVTFSHDVPYDSENYLWFSKRYERFLYLDRIVLHEDFRRRGLGGCVYEEIEADATPYGRLTLEVNLVPRNDASLAFHGRRGYVEVGRLGDAQHLVSLLEKRLA